MDSFSQSLHQMKAFWVQMIDLKLFSDISRDVAMATNIVKKMANSPHSSLWHSETDGISLLQCAD